MIMEIGNAKTGDGKRRFAGSAIGDEAIHVIACGGSLKWWEMPRRSP